ncbi:MAG: pilus assembly protein PilM, partial [Candidatus Omnitrophica bacterium]|nr:pilus assembly protein PilM [Candidatus Omnitrophota bacterium]
MNTPKLFTKDDILALEITDGVLKLAQVTFKKHKPALTLASRVFSSMSTEARAKDIEGLLASLGGARGTLVFTIPRHMVMTRFIELPSINDNEIRAMIEVEALKHTPYASDDIIHSYKVIRKDPGGYSQVLLAIVKKEQIDEYTAIARILNVTVDKIAVGAESLAAWLDVVMKGELKRRSGHRLLANIDSRQVSLIFLDGENLTYTRAFKLSGSMPQSGNAPDLGAAVNEIVKTLTAYQRQKNAALEDIMVTGGAGLAHALAPLLRSASTFSVSEVAQTMNIDCVTSEADMAGSSFCEVIGLALVADKVTMNLLPQDIIRRHEENKVKKDIILTAVLGVLTIALISGLAVKDIIQKTAIVNKLDEELMLIKPGVDKIKKMQDDVAIVKEATAGRPAAVNILREVYSLTPEGIS